MDKDNKKTENEKLILELEELRTLVEKTLKQEREKAEEEKKNPGISEDMLIQDVEDIEEPYKAEKAEPHCIYCDKKLSKKETASGRGYCNTCYAGMKRRPLKMKGILTVLVMAVVFFGAAFTSMDAIMDIDSVEDEEYKLFFEGYVDCRDNRLITGEANYRKYLSQRSISSNVSEKAVRQLIDTYCTLGEYPQAVQIIETYYSDFELSMPWNSKYRKVIERNDAYRDIAGILEVNRTEKGIDFKKVIDEVAALKNKYGSEVEYIIDVYVARYTIAVEKDNEVIYKNWLEIDEKYGNKESLHITSLCHYAALAGDKEVVDDCFNRMMKINSQDMSIYVACFNYYRYLDTPDTEKMLELCRKMLELSGELARNERYNRDYLYCFAIAYMLKGDAGESSFRMMQELYWFIQDCNYYGVYYEGNSTAKNIFNLYALTALYTGNTEAYEWAKAEMEYLGYELSDIVEKYRSGEMTLAQVIADKGGDIA